MQASPTSLVTTSPLPVVFTTSSLPSFMALERNCHCSAVSFLAACLTRATSCLSVKWAP